MPRKLIIEVEWPKGHLVKVDVRVEEIIGGGFRKRVDAEPPPPDVPEAVYTFSEGVLESKARLVAFLERITRGQADGATVEALCFSSDFGLLLERLGAQSGSSAHVKVGKRGG